MARSRPRTTTAATDDSALAGPVGAVLLLALALTAYGAIALREVPQWGRDAEHDWEGKVQASLATLAAASSRGVGQASPVASSLPMATDPQSIDVPLFGPLRPLPPSGSVSFHPACASFEAAHTVGGSTINDLAGGAPGCLVFDAETAYAPGFTYQLELGGLLRIQGSRAVVITGPPLELTDQGATYRVGLSLASLQGPALGSSSSESVRVDLLPGGSLLDGQAFQNAGSVSWTLHTAYPDAWTTWYEQRLAAAGFDPTMNYVDDACAPLPGLACLVVHIGGTTGDHDLNLALAHGIYDVSLR